MVVVTGNMAILNHASHGNLRYIAHVSVQRSTAGHEYWIKAFQPLMYTSVRMYSFRCLSRDVDKFIGFVLRHMAYYISINYTSIHTKTHARTHIYTDNLTHVHTLELSLTHTHSHTLTHSLTRTHSPYMNEFENMIVDFSFMLIVRRSSKSTYIKVH